MLKGLIVDNMVIGGPAYNSGILKKGDIILAIDGVVTTEETVLSMLLGEDIPGSAVTLNIAAKSRCAFASIRMLRKLSTIQYIQVVPPTCSRL